MHLHCIYSDWVINAKCIVGTVHMLKTKPVVLWVHNASFIVGVSGNHDNSDTRVGLRKIVPIFLYCSHKGELLFKAVGQDYSKFNGRHIDYHSPMRPIK